MDFEKNNEEIEDFTEEHSEVPKRFKLNGHIFECASVLPAGGTQLLAKMSQSSEMQAVMLLGEFLSVVMYPDSAALFNDVITDPKQPVTDMQLVKIMQHLIKVYSGGRPTMQPSTSVPGPNGTGTTLTAGVPLTE